jgi:hypothetical protein
MVVCDSNVGGSPIAPEKADPVLVVDRDAPLAFTIVL